MSSQQRFGLIALAAAVAVAAFLIARPGDDEDSPATSAATTPAQTETVPPESAPAPEETVTEEEEPPAPESIRIRVRGGEPVGGVAEVAVSKGDTVRLVVSADSPQQVHVHGYDLFEDAAPGAAARFTFDADLEGVFEVELEGSHVQVAELRVEP